MSSTPGIIPVKKHQFLFGDAVFDIAYILQDKVFTKPTAERDGIHIEGTDYDKPVLVTNCTVDFSDCTEETDELVSVVHGGIVIFDHCTFRCGRKAALMVRLDLKYSLLIANFLILEDVDRKYRVIVLSE